MNQSDPMVCARCGTIHRPLPQCQKHRKSDGAQCGRDAMRGTDACYMHGSASPQSKRAAARRLAEADVARTLGELGVPIPTSDGEALQELRDRYRGIVAALWQLAAGLNLVPEGAGADGIWGRTYHQTGTPTGEAKPHVVMVMLGDWSDRLAKVDEACVRLGLAERRVRAEEGFLGLLAAALDVALARVVPVELHGEFRQVWAGELRRLDVLELPAGEEETK